MTTQNWLAWLTPILATITAILDAGHLTHVIPSEVAVLILAIVTAVVGFIAAMSKEKEQKPQQFGPPQAQQQPPQAQKK